MTSKNTTEKKTIRRLDHTKIPPQSSPKSHHIPICQHITMSHVREDIKHQTTDKPPNRH